MFVLEICSYAGTAPGLPDANLLRVFWAGLGQVAAPCPTTTMGDGLFDEETQPAEAGQGDLAHLSGGFDKTCPVPFGESE